MKNAYRKWIATAAVAAMTAGLLAGCGSGSSTDSSSQQASTEAATTAETAAAAETAATEAAAEEAVYTGTAQGKNGDVTVAVTLDGTTITKVEVTDQQETEGIADPALEQVPQEIVDAQSVNVDTVSGATVTSTAIIEAAKAALESAGIDTSAMADASGSAAENVPVTYTAGTYTGTGSGYNGDVVLDVTFSDDAITDIVINSSSETNHVGSVAFDIMFQDAKDANGSGIDSVSGATFTSAAIKAALNDAAEQAGASDLDGFRKNTVVHEAQDPIDVTYDVVIVGSGGAGMSAAVQSAQNGNSVLVIEENAEIGGNTCVSGGQFQSVMPYLVWDPDDPDATTGVYEYNGKTYDKLTSTEGYINTLKIIDNWSEDEFDEDYYKDHDFVAGDIEELSKHGVHKEYLQTLKDLKSEIEAYLDWAQPKLDAGTAENKITLFSTVNLHIFQTYYGGLRPSADKTQWVYGDYDLVSQFINGGQGLKEWLEDQGALFDDDKQPTIIGALWDRENNFEGGDLDGDGEADDDAKGVFGTYFSTMRNTLLNTVDNHADNAIMLRTKADELLTDDDGKVTGVHAVQYDGTEVTAHANKGVVLATGGYAANIDKVLETNVYWDSEYLTEQTKTTNRSSLVGDGLTMAEALDAGETGLGWTQLMPISWVDNGNLAFGAGTYAVYINPTTGKRFVNESAERDVLSLAEFENGVDHDGVKGTFMEFANAEQAVPGPYIYGVPGDASFDEDVSWRQYTITIDELGDLLDELGFEADPDVIREEIETYDKAVMGDGDYPDADKSGASRLIGQADQDEDGNYIEDTYTLDGVKLKVRILAPSTHHTMGGLTVDTERHVLKEDGEIIDGLYAAGEVTGGIHGGNRLGGNAIVEILVSGRTAANTIQDDNS